MALGITLAPFYFYKTTLEGNFPSTWYQIKNFDQLYLTPTRYPYTISDEYSSENIWKKFQFKDVLIPMPYRNPLIQVIPIFGDEKSKKFEIGFQFLNVKNQLVGEVHFMPNSIYNISSRGQKLFELPIAKALIRSKSASTIWSDLFSLEINNKKKKLDYLDMIYHLYILHIRSQFIPKQAISYGHVGQQNIGIIRMEPANKDFTAELVLTMKQNIVYSYFILTKNDNPDGIEIRDRLLNEISFQAGNTYIGDINYREFKSLPLSKQTNQEGMLHLLSAWSNSDNKQALIAELIYYLEKGNMWAQLQPTYLHAFKLYGKTLSKRSQLLTDIPELILQKNIEIEDDKKIEDTKLSTEINPKKKIIKKSRQEIMKDKLEAAKLKKRERKTKLQNVDINQ
jgi:hypothetical protein